jgi:hypothetical protein
VRRGGGDMMKCRSEREGEGLEQEMRGVGRPIHKDQFLVNSVLTKFVRIISTNHSYGSSSYQHLTYPFLLQT